MSRRTDRVGENLLEVLAQILLREVKDPRVANVTLTGIDVAPDLRSAHVRFSTLADVSLRDAALAGLRSAAPFMQGKAARLVRMKNTPKLQFEYDDGFDHAAHMDTVLQRDGIRPEESDAEPTPNGDDPEDDT